ncbi:MAG TPA: ATP-binding cassette domain-containing protein [Fluviicola sp.]|nr:ATP-binding cassette domain-containing protein [Fluviicola sp.]
MEKVIQIQDGRIEQLGQTVLDKINIEVHSDELVFLIGRTGSGKSSLLKVLYGELDLAEGTGKIANFDLKRLTKRQVPLLRRQLGIVFQDFQLLLDRSVRENLLFVMKATGWTNKREIDNRISTVLAMVGLDGKEHLFPHRLSGGEQQRVAIARALINHPKVIIADEPTGNLDPETSIEIMQLIIAVAKEEKAAVIMATHDMNLIEKFPGKVYKVENHEMKPMDTMHRFDPFQPLFD